MPKEDKVLFETHPDFPVDTHELLRTTMSTFVAKASKEHITIELHNNAKQPFKIISKPGGSVMWGVGGCGVGG